MTNSACRGPLAPLDPAVAATATPCHSLCASQCSIGMLCSDRKRSDELGAVLVDGRDGEAEAGDGLDEDTADGAASVSHSESRSTPSEALKSQYVNRRRGHRRMAAMVERVRSAARLLL